MSLRIVGVLDPTGVVPSYTTDEERSFYFTLSSNIRATCVEQSMSIEKLCEVTKIDQDAYNAFEKRGMPVPTLKQIYKIAVALDTPLHELMGLPEMIEEQR